MKEYHKIQTLWKREEKKESEMPICPHCGSTPLDDGYTEDDYPIDWTCSNSCYLDFE